MTAPNCVRCPKPVPDQAYACTGCGVTKPAEQLATIVDMTPAARDIAHGQARHGSTSGGSDEGRLPLNLGATQRLDSVQATLTGWARHIAEERGKSLPLLDAMRGPTCSRCGHGSCAVIRSRETLDPISATASWLVDHLEWLRHQRYADEALADIAACARIVAGIARGPAAQRFLGPCGAVADADAIGTHGSDGSLAYADDPMPTNVQPIEPCDGDVYARDGAQRGACRACGAQVVTRDRQAWLDAEARSWAYRASEIEDAYGVNANTIRSWAARGHLAPHGHDRYERPLFNLGEVLDLAAADAARRAGEQAKRARRAAARAAEEVSTA